jgi:predicted enzyme related to lactoylglutathione lyase
MANAINWFEIPATNHERAVRFYSQVLGRDLQPMEMAGVKMAFLPADEGEIGGAICTGEGYKPSVDGTLVYLNGGEDLNTPLSKVEKAGGKVVMPKTKISDEIGYMAFFTDSEGNKIALHSPK